MTEGAVTRASPAAAILACYAASGYDSAHGLWMNLGLWRGPSTYRDAAAALAYDTGLRARLDARATLVDVGCGFGDAALLWHEQLGVRRIHAVTPDQTQRRVFRRRLGGTAARTAVAVHAGTADRLPVATGTATHVVALESAFHFPNRHAFAKEARRVLVPGGTLVVADLVPLDHDWQHVLTVAGFSVGSIERLGDQVFPGAAAFLDALNGPVALDELVVEPRAADRNHAADRWRDAFGIEDFVVVVAHA